MAILASAGGHSTFSKFFLYLLIAKFHITQIIAYHERNVVKQRWDLRIGIVHDPPRTVVKRDPIDDSIVDYSGFMKEILGFLLKDIANSTIPVEIPLNAQQKRSGVETPVLNYISSGRVDISSRLLPLGASSANLVDITYPILITQMCLVQPMPGPLQKYSILFYSFEPLVWLWFGIALIATTLALTILMKRKTIRAVDNSNNKLNRRSISKDKAQKKNVPEVASYILGSTVSRGRRLLTNRVLVQIVAGAWSLAAFVFVYSYRGVMIAKVYAPAQMALINTFEDVVQTDRRLLVGRNTPYANILLNSSTGTLKAVGDILRRNPDDVIVEIHANKVATCCQKSVLNPKRTQTYKYTCSTYVNPSLVFLYQLSNKYSFEQSIPTVILPIMENVYDILLTGCCTYLEDASFADMLVYRAMKEHQDECRLTKGKNLKAQTPLGLFIAHNLKFRPALDLRIMRLWESGLNQHLAKRAVNRRIEKCTGNSVSGRFLRSPQPLTLVTLSAAFVILVSGAGLSFLVFLIEVLVSHHKERRRRSSTKRRKRSVQETRTIEVRPNLIRSANYIEETKINDLDSTGELNSISSSSLNSSIM